MTNSIDPMAAVKLLREALEECLATYRATNRQPETTMKAEAQLDRIGKANAQADEALRLTDLIEQPTSEAVDKRRCKKCATQRGGTHCWKCGSETFEPDPRCGTEPRLPPIDRIRELAKEVGYAVGVHGSQQRDFDVIAAPWSEDAVGNHALMEHIAAGLTTDNGPARIVSTERKPLGRYSATIQMDGWYKQLDISVCPFAAPPALPAPDPTDAQKLATLREGLHELGWCAEFGALAKEVLDGSATPMSPEEIKAVWRKSRDPIEEPAGAPVDERFGGYSDSKSHAENGFGGGSGQYRIEPIGGGGSSDSSESGSGGPSDPNVRGGGSGNWKKP